MRSTQQAKASAARRGGLRRRVLAGLCMLLLLWMILPLSVSPEEARAAMEASDIRAGDQVTGFAKRGTSTNSTSRQMLILAAPQNADEETISEPIIVRYQSADKDMGNVSLIEETVQPGGTAEGTTVTSVAGCEFLYWTRENDIEIVSYDLNFKPGIYKTDEADDDAAIYHVTKADFESGEPVTFVAHFQKIPEKKISIVISKVWANNLVPEDAEAVITLYKQVDNQTTAIEEIRLDGKIDGKGETEAWKAAFRELPEKENGSPIVYKVQEISGTEGYSPFILDGTKEIYMSEDVYLSPSLSTDDQGNQQGAGTITNEANTLITIRKMDKDDDTLMPGVEMKLLRRNENSEAEAYGIFDDGTHENGIYTTGEEDETLGLICISLPNGNYRLHEETIPEHYTALEEDIEFTVKDGKIILSESTGEYAFVDEEDAALLTIVNEKIKHTVTYQYDDTAPEGAPELPEVQAHGVGNAVKVEDAVFTGYTFSGWKTQDAAVVDGAFTMPDKDVVLTGSWKINTCTVIYEYEGDVPAKAPSVPVRRVYNYGTALELAEEKSLAGYTFSGWSTQDVQIAKDGTFTMPDHDVYIRGSWTANDDQLTYQSNGGTGTMASTRGKVDQKVKVSDSEFTRKGYAFTGWNTRPSGLGTAYAAGDEYQLTAREDILYAQWERESYPYTVHYYLKGTTTKVAEDTLGTALYGSRVPVPEEEPDFLEAYEGYQLTRDSSNPLVSLAIGTGENVITIYYTLPLTISVADRTVVYSGSRQYGYTLEDEDAVTVEGLLTTDKLNSKLYSSAYGTTVADTGVFNGRFDRTQIPGYYTLTLNAGGLIIQPRPVIITITGRITEKVYNGVEYSANGYEAKADDPLYKTFYISFEGERKVSRKDVGTTTIGLTAARFGNLNPNFTATFRVTDGYVTVTPRTMKITTGSATRDYNGKELTNGTAKLSGLAATDKVSLKATGSLIDVGQVINGYAIEWLAGSPANYVITEELGTLEVTPAKVKITTGSATKAYDGEPLTKEDAKISGLASGETVTLKATGTITEVGETDNGYSIVWDNAKESNYIIESENLGTLKVTEARTTPTISGRSGGSYSRVSTGSLVTLKVIYSTSDGKNVPETVAVQMKSGDDYYVVSPFLDGYEADTQIVEGTITKDTTVRVKYTKTKYNLEIRYVTLDGAEIAAGFNRSYSYGEAYSVDSPSLEGYTAAQTTVSGTMGGTDLRFTVMYLPMEEENTGRNVSTLRIEDYETPLGLGGAYQQIGVCLE